jgi:DNA modification methylase
MDPWNGSGTTTKVSGDMGFSAIGFDINPVMVIVAKAKLLSCSATVREQVLTNLKTIIGLTSGFRNERLYNEDPLNAWLEPESAMCFRSIERAIQFLLISNEYHSIYTQDSLSHISSLASFFYVALFKTLRSFLKPYVSSNPTWIKIASAKKDYIHPSANDICTELHKQVHSMIDAVILDNVDTVQNSTCRIKIERASSESIPLPNSSIDFVISSPPYCTRIDYAIATSPELALLGCSMSEGIKSLRDRMIGTPTMIGKISEVRLDWGLTCTSFLNTVETHESKASKSYYYRYFTQYFDSIYKSFLEIDRILITSGKCVIVVQDSYYKDIHNDLPRIFCEMADSLNWVILDRFNFQVKRNMAGRNNRSKKYRKNSDAVECVLIFKK